MIVTVLKIDQAGERVNNLGLDLSHVIGEWPIGCLDRPGEATARIHAIAITTEGACEFVRLKATNESDQKVVDVDAGAVHALNSIVTAVPRFEPEFVVLPA